MTSLDYLAGLEFHGIKLGLDNISRLLSDADNPHYAYPSVHIAGTNGKGSVAAMVDAILQSAGYRTGRFTSPHLTDLRERFMVNSQLIDAADLDESILRFQRIAEGLNMTPTYFELVTAVAFHHFARAQVDIAVVEVGMGGRFDSTNVVRPSACAITAIGLDHMQYLGGTIEQIAFEKAGILKRDVPGVVSDRDPVVRRIIEAAAETAGAPMQFIGEDFDGNVEGDPFSQTFRYTSGDYTLGPTPLGLAGSYQGDNAAAAVALARLLSPSMDRITDEAIREGLAAARWPCRMERVLETPPVVIDVAHNPSGAKVLAEQVPPAIVVLAISSDKDALSMAEALAPVTHHLILSQFAGHRAMSVEELSRKLGGRPHEAISDLREAIAKGMALADSDHPLLITGSIFTAGEARQILVDDWAAPPPRF